MKIEGTQKIDAPRDRIFAALVDPAILQKCIPGCEQMEKTGDNQYKAKLTAGVGPVKGVFTATISLQEIVAPEHYKLVVEGKGQPGFVKGSGELNLKDADGATEIQYTGDVNIGGLIASVGQRMIQATANMLTARFFKSLEAETAAHAQRPDRKRLPAGETCSRPSSLLHSHPASPFSALPGRSGSPAILHHEKPASTCLLDRQLPGAAAPCSICRLSSAGPAARALTLYRVLPPDL